MTAIPRVVPLVGIKDPSIGDLFRIRRQRIGIPLKGRDAIRSSHMFGKLVEQFEIFGGVRAVFFGQDDRRQIFRISWDSFLRRDPSVKTDLVFFEGTTHAIFLAVPVPKPYLENVEFVVRRLAVAMHVHPPLLLVGKKPVVELYLTHVKFSEWQAGVLAHLCLIQRIVLRKI